MLLMWYTQAIFALGCTFLSFRLLSPKILLAPNPAIQWHIGSSMVMQQAIASSIRLQLAWIAVGRFVRSTSCVPIVYMLVIIVMRGELSSQQSQSSKLVFTVISIRQTIRTFNRVVVVVPLSQSARAGTTATLCAEEPKPVWWHRQSMRPHCDSHHSSYSCCWCLRCWMLICLSWSAKIWCIDLMYGFILTMS